MRDAFAVLPGPGTLSNLGPVQGFLLVLPRSGRNVETMD
jgi:hypothetical protein